MKSDRNPLFRQAISPWYDSDAVCAVVIILMVTVLLFSLSGVWVVQSYPQFRPHLWVPLCLACLCLYVIFSVSIRLFQRKYSRRSDKL